MSKREMYGVGLLASSVLVALGFYLEYRLRREVSDWPWDFTGVG